TGLNPKELKEYKNKTVGELVRIDSTQIEVIDLILNGKLKSKIDTINVIDGLTIPDSMSYNKKYFCQEVFHFNGITKQALSFFKIKNNFNYIPVLRFECKDDIKLNCGYIYRFSNEIIGLCLPADGMYILKK